MLNSLKLLRVINKSNYCLGRKITSGNELSKTVLKLKNLAKDGKIKMNLDDINGIGVLTLCNYKRRNAITAQMMLDLHGIAIKLNQWKNGKAVILVGEEDEFCSGLDLSVGRTFTTQDDGKEMCMYMQTVLSMLQKVPQITVSAVNGKALGGGAELMLCTDFRLGFANTKVQYLQKTMGITPGWGGVTRLNHLVGYKNSLDLLASAKALNPQEAFEMGLIDHIFDEDSNAINLATDWLEKQFKLSKTPAYVFQAIKSATSQVEILNEIFDKQFHNEKEVFGNVWYGPAMQQTLSSMKHGKT